MIASFAQYPMPVRDFFQNVAQKPFAVFDHPFLMAGRTEMTTFAQKWQKIF
jgi:hypothetical protein